MTRKSPSYEELEQRVKGLEEEARRCKETEEKLETYQFMIESAHDAIFFKDLESRYINVNKKTLEAFGLSREDVLGKNDFELMPKQKEAKTNVSDDQVVFKSGKPTEVTKHMTGADGKEYWFQAIKVPKFNKDGKVIGLVGIARDITKHRETEEALRMSEERYRSIAENSLVGFWQVTLEGHTIYINPAMCRLLEIEDPKEFHGKTYESFVNDENREIIKRELAKRKKGISSTYEVELIGRKGTKRNVMISGAPIFLSENKIHSTIGTFTDITEKKRVEKALMKAHDELEHRVKERTRELEIKTKNLEEVNIAMKVLLKKREEDKKDIEHNILTNVRKFIDPYFEKIRKTKLDSQQKAFLNIMESNLKEITSQFAHKISLRELNLTPTEIQVANMIRHGNSSKVIAEIMNISVRTVDTHRRNIRKKIGLNQKRVNLRSYLLSLN